MQGELTLFELFRLAEFTRSAPAAPRLKMVHT